MEDGKIVDMLFERQEQAIEEVDKKYGRYCYVISYGILNSAEDAKECVNDTYARVWESIPPHRPKKLSAFIGRITRNLSLDRYDRAKAQKRASGIGLIYDELEEMISEGSESALDSFVLRDAINSYLARLPKRTRIIFVRRYWYLSPISEIAEDMGLSESNVKAILFRARAKLKAHLEKEGISV